MQRPNFFIIGAPKCGTTSLAAWLADHDRIFMPPMKEPHFFNTDGRPLTRNRRHYEALFAAAEPGHLATGEASTGYLSSRKAVSEILDYTPTARFIVCLRNPVDMAIALHEQRVFEGKEPIRDFAAAWPLEGDRRTQQRGTDLLYADTCAIGVQMEQLFDNVTRDRVQVVLLDDMRHNPARIYRDVLAFLGVPDDDRSDFPVHNPAKERRYRGVNHVIRHAAALKRRLGIQRGLGLLNRVDRRNTRERERVPVDIGLRRELADYFDPEVARLSAVLDRDLMHWVRYDRAT